MNPLIFWWLFFWVQTLGYGIASYFGMFQLMWAADFSKISFVIFAAHFFITLWLGVKTHTKMKGHKFREETGWFLAESMLTLGMIGTVVGFIYMIETTIGSLSGAVTVESLRSLVNALAYGIGTALWTTLIGLIASLCLKVQLNNIEGIIVAHRKY